MPNSKLKYFMVQVDQEFAKVKCEQLPAKCPSAASFKSKRATTVLGFSNAFVRNPNGRASPERKVECRFFAQDNSIIWCLEQMPKRRILTEYLRKVAARSINYILKSTFCQRQLLQINN